MLQILVGQKKKSSTCGFWLTESQQQSFLQLKPVAKADAAGIMSAVLESLEHDAALNFGAWTTRLVGFGADGPAVGHRVVQWQS